MAQKKERKYLNGMRIWEKTFDNGGSVLNISVDPTKFWDEISQLPKDEKYGSVKFSIGKRKEPDAKSKATHYAYVDIMEDANYDYPKGNTDDGF